MSTADLKEKCETVTHSTGDVAVCGYCRQGAAEKGGICQSCKDLPAMEFIYKYAMTDTESQNPYQMMLHLLNAPNIRMHGPEHHFLVPAVLLASYYNIQGDQEKKAQKLVEAKKRCGNIVGGFCGFYGCCGAAVGNGVFFSLITNTTPKSSDTWSLSNRITSQTLEVIAESGGPRCCKSCTYLAIDQAVDFVDQQMGVQMGPKSPVVCGFSLDNPDCKTTRCRFNGANN